MTVKPKVDYFIVKGKIVNRGDEGFEELEAKYVKEIEIKEQDPNTSKKEKGGK